MLVEQTGILDKEVMDLLKIYERNKEPIEVNFREMLPDHNKSEKYSHLIHWYPAKLLSHIPYFFLNNNIFSKPGDIVLDPFCGSGTVLLEGLLASRNSVGADANPLARLISKVKVTKHDAKELRTVFSKLIYLIKSTDRFKIQDVINKDYWFSQKTQIDLGKIYYSIENYTSGDTKDFFMVCFSYCVRKVSLTDPRISVPVKINYNKYEEGSIKWKKEKELYDNIANIDAIEKFEEIVNSNIIKVDTLLSKDHNYYAKIISKDARNITCSLSEDQKLDNESIDLIITSPPYAGAQKYIRSSFLNLGWLGLAEKKDIKILDNKSIGREEHPKSLTKSLVYTGIDEADYILKQIFDISPTRAYIAAKYISEMKDALDESYRVLKTGKHLVLVLGNNQICGLEFNTQQYLTSYLLSKNMKVNLRLIDNIKSYGLMTKRNKTANIITREWVIVLEK